MAGYIEWSKGLAEKREVLIMAHTLKVDPDLVAARLMRFWEWCDDNIPEDAIDKDTEDAVIVLSPNRGDTETFIDGKARLEGLAKLLASRPVSWIKHLGNGRVKLVRYGRHNGTTAKTRVRNARNQAKRRANGVSDMSPLNGDKIVTTPTQPNPTHRKGVGRSVGESLEGVQGEPIEFVCLQRVEDLHLTSVADLCAIHRAAHAEHPEIVDRSEDALLCVISAANRARKKARESPTAFFRGIFRKRKLGTFTKQERAEARPSLESYRACLREQQAKGVEILERHVPLCDTITPGGSNAAAHG